MKKLLLILCIAAPAALYAQSDALPFTAITLGPELSGTAGAAVAAPAGAWTAFRGAASGAMTAADGIFSGAAGYRYFGGHSRTSVAMGLAPRDNFFVSGGFSYNVGDEVAGYRTNDMTIAAGAGYAIGDNFSVGANLRFANQSLTEEISYSGISVDLSALYKLTDDLSVTGGVSTLGGKVKSASGTEYSQPANVYGGVDYFLPMASSMAMNLDLAAEYYFSGNYAAALGARFNYGDMFHARAGYRFASKNCVLPSHFAAGVGAEFSGLTLDVNFMKFPSASAIAVGIAYSL